MLPLWGMQCMLGSVLQPLLPRLLLISNTVYSGWKSVSIVVPGRCKECLCSDWLIGFIVSGKTLRLKVKSIYTIIRSNFNKILMICQTHRSLWTCISEGHHQVFPTVIMLPSSKVQL